MKILVTGGAGYIGTTLVPMLLNEGHQVNVLDSLLHGGNGLLPVVGNDDFKFFRGDIRDRDDVQQAMEDCDAVIHLAAIVGFPACRKFPELAQTTNVDGTRIVAEVAGLDRLVLFGSTGSNYGAITDQVCTEETPLNPLSHYGRTKTTAEQFLLDRGNAIAYRFATAFGLSPRLRLDLLVNDFVFTAISQKYLVVYEKNFMRSFIHVRDMARSFLFGLEKSDQMNGEVYNVGDESMNYSKGDICDLISDKIEYYCHYADVGEDPDKRNYVVSYDKIRNVGYKTTVSIDQGLNELIAGLQLVTVQSPYSNA